MDETTGEWRKLHNEELMICRHTHTHTRAHAHTHTRAHAHAHTRAHAHTHWTSDQPVAEATT